MASQACKKSDSHSVLEIILKGRVSPPEFLERRIPALGNTFVAERTNGQTKRSHSRGIGCSNDDSKAATAELSQVEHICGFFSSLGDQQPDKEVSAMDTRHTKHVIALSQLLDQDSELHELPLVRSIAPDGLVTSDEFGKRSAVPAQLSTSVLTFNKINADKGPSVEVGAIPVVDIASKGVTLIVRNIPRQILQEQILMQLRNDGFTFGTGHLDLALLYAPAVFGGHLGKPQGQGFGFVHANSSDAARAFMARWHRRHIFGTGREVRALDISKAHVQGVQANLAQWSQTKTRRIRNSRFQPYVADGILTLESSTDCIAT